MRNTYQNLAKNTAKRALASINTIPGVRYAKYHRKQRLKGTYTATVRDLEDGIVISAGPLSFHMRSLEGEWIRPPTYDAVAFNLAALSLTHGYKFEVDMPISNAVAQRIQHISNVLRLWTIDRISALRLDFPQTVPVDGPDRDPGTIVCLSGGVDSTYAATVASRDGTLGACLLIAGADYADARGKGFPELRERVSSIASVVGKDLSLIETDVRKAGFQWEMLHGFNLAACLHFYSATYRAGGFALDNTIYQDVVRNPWGNNAALPGMVSTDRFPVHGFGSTTNRVEKLRVIHDFEPGLIDLLSVCWEYGSSGRNCGHCRKCTETRLGLHAVGISDRQAFVSHPPLVDAIDKFRVGATLSTVKGQFVRTAEIVDALPEGPVRSRLRDFEEALRKRYCAMDPLR